MFEDVEEAMAAAGQSRRRYCGFMRWAQTLEPADTARAVALVEGRDYSCTQLAQYFETKGAELNHQVLNRHRNKACCGQRRS